MNYRRENVFIFTKPLQYFNIKSIPYANYFDVNDKKTLIVINNFVNAKGLYERIRREDDFWDLVVFCNKYKDAFKYIWTHFFIKNLIINCDLGVETAITCCIRGFNTYTYEEGIGSYGLWERSSERGPLYDVITSIVRLLFGNGKIMNESRWLKGCFLYQPDLFKSLRPHTKTEALPMKNSFSNQLIENFDYYTNVFNIDFSKYESIKYKKILLYITTWNVDNNIVREVDKNKNQFDYVFIKLHPHIRNTESLVFPSCKDYIFVESQMMVELFISLLLKNHNEITIYHNNSTSIVYFQNVVKQISFSKDELSQPILDYIKAAK